MRCSSQLAVMPTYALFEAKKSGVMMNDVIKLTAWGCTVELFAVLAAYVHVPSVVFLSELKSKGWNLRL